MAEDEAAVESVDGAQAVDESRQPQSAAVLHLDEHACQAVAEFAVERHQRHLPMFVAESVRVTVASATAAFDGSVTVPAIVPELMFCEYVRITGLLLLHGSSGKF